MQTVDYRDRDQREERVNTGAMMVGTAVGHIVVDALHIGFEPNIVRAIVDEGLDVIM